MSYGCSRSIADDRKNGHQLLKRLYKTLLRYFQSHSSSSEEEEIPWNSPLPVYPARWVGTKATSTPIRARRLRRAPRRLRMAENKTYSVNDDGTYNVVSSRSPIRVITTPRAPVVLARRPRITGDTYTYQRRGQYLPRRPVIVGPSDYPTYSSHVRPMQTYRIDYATSATSTDGYYLSSDAYN